MINSKKKGFTIVELVIVIAVIAVLAAVLIPTFSNLVKKANISADTQAVKQMNTALAIESVDKKPSSDAEVIVLLEKSGFNTEEGLIPVTSKHSFYWHKGYNVIVLVNNETNTVVFPVDNEELVSSFATDVNNSELVFNLKDTNNTIKVGGVICNSLHDAIDAAVDSGEPVVLHQNVTVLCEGIDEEITIDSGESVTIDLNGYTIVNESTYNDPDSPATLYNLGTLVIEGDGQVLCPQGYAVFNKGNLTINGGTYIGGLKAICSTTGSVTINDGTFKCSSKELIVNNYEAAVIWVGNENVEIPSSLTINGGTFETNIEKLGLVVIGDSNTHLIINNGTFNALNEYVEDFYGDIYTTVGSNGSSTINGGTFNACIGGHSTSIKGGIFNENIILDDSTISGGTFNCESVLLDNVEYLK